jgi:hypothetical protein
VNWEVKKKREAAEMLRNDVMSSEESDYEGDENGNPKVSGYKIKRLPWETEKVKKIKKKLDKTYKKS